MILQTISFGFVSKFFLNNDPGIAILFAGILLLLAAVAVLRIEEKHDVGAEGVPMGGGGH
jgi:maltose/moltooligosaccharide transporter